MEVEDDFLGSGPGLFWASVRKEKKGRWARFGPNKEGSFFPKVFSKSVFQIHFAILGTI
jgi:hypothetical protein